MEKNFYIEETKMCLTSKKSFKEIATEFNCSCTTLADRFYKTIIRLVDYYDFDNIKIEYPSVIDEDYHRKFRNARKHSDFWIRIVNDYEKGVKMYKHNLPIEVSESRKIFELTISEFRELITSVLKEHEENL
jgi:GH18 family chitinase